MSEPQVSFPKERNRSKERKGFPFHCLSGVYCWFDEETLSWSVLCVFSSGLGYILNRAANTASALFIYPTALFIEMAPCISGSVLPLFCLVPEALLKL